MAYNDNQNEPALPAGNENYKRKTENHLPRYFRTRFNKKFLQSTVDQLTQPGVVEKINSYYGRKTAKAYKANDNYVGDVDKQREDYQLEPASIIKDELGNVNYYADYNDFTNKLNAVGNINKDHSIVNQQEYYAWNPHIDWDKFVNFREYYWLPSGPQLITVVGQSRDIESTYSLELADNVDNVTYKFTPDGLTNNPTLTLYRGQTYKFDIDVPGHPIAFATKKSFTPGASVLVEATDGIRSPGVYDIGLYDQEGLVYDGGGYIVEPAEASFTAGTSQNTSLIYDTGVKQYNDEGEEQSVVYLEKGTIEFTVPETAPDRLYYISKNDPNISGFIRIFDIIENTEINVENEIIGKKTYKTTGGFELSNGMQVEFAGNVTPASYGTGQYFVEGVGDKIKLIPAIRLETSGDFTKDIDLEFDVNAFDFYPFDKAIGFPDKKDYIVIHRSSTDGNLWSRYNKWFHKDVIEKSAQINNRVVDIDVNARASRPIVEFEPGLKLYNFGTQTKDDVDLIDNFTKDAFSTIEGSQGYNIDGVDVTNGMRILFTADTDLLVKNRIYQVKFITVNNISQITLTEIADTNPILNETVLITNGTTNRGKYYFYNGIEWKATQAKTKVNQPPMFDLFDKDGKSLSDATVYASTNFIGNTVFEYKIGTGRNDTELGFPLSYRNIENSGDIVFNFKLLNDKFAYQDQNEIIEINTDTAYVRLYDSIDNFRTENGWIKADSLSNQYVLRQYVFDNSTNDFAIDVYDSVDLSDLWIRVYKNNKLQFRSTDYTIVSDSNNDKAVRFVNDLKLDDVILLKTKSSKPKNENGLYEIVANLEKNPLNENLNEFTIGEVVDHVSTIVESYNNFQGVFPGVSNLRDAGPISKLGTKFVKHSSPFNLPTYHLVDKSANIVLALDFARIEYSKFKRRFLETADTLGYDGPIKSTIEEIFKELNKDKTTSMPFFFSDMAATLGSIKTSYTIEDPDEQYFPLSTAFFKNKASKRSVLVYNNNIQLTYGKDYTFDDDGFINYTGTKSQDDIVDIYEYENTNGSFIPPTPTKLGLYPSYIPKLYIDDSVNAEAPADESGPWKIYASDDKGKLGWYYPLYADIQDAKTRDTELGGSGQAHAHKFDGLNRTFFMPNSSMNHATRDNESISEWPQGLTVIQGHDGSRYTAFKDYRDELLLDLELRIYNNLKQPYDTTLFDLADFVPGQYRPNSINKTDFDTAITADFVKWAESINADYTSNTYFDRNNTFSFNYKGMNFTTGGRLPGWWREIYRLAYDTDRPHTHPWEMLGFNDKPSWWEDVYGPAPYTRNNELLWNDIENGFIKEPNKKLIVNSKFARPGISSHQPVDESGNLLSPNDSGIVTDFSISGARDNYSYGDGAPVENGYKRTSEYPFSIIKSIVINRPNRVFATIFDRQRQTRNSAGQLQYNSSENQIILKNIIFPSTKNDATQIFTSGLVNYIADYMSSDSLQTYQSYKDNLKSITNQIGFKVGGFTDKEKFRLLLDSRTPLNQGNVFVPDENYKIFLNESSALKEVSYSGVIIEKLAQGFIIRGYDTRTPSFTYFKPIKLQNDPFINVGGVSERFVEYTQGRTYTTGTLVSFNGAYYRAKENLTNVAEFDSSKFARLPSLPVVGGVSAQLRRQYESTPSILKYGEVLQSFQDVVDFLLGYGAHLEYLGFQFENFDDAETEVQNWNTAARQFLFWTSQNWRAGTVLTISPNAENLKFKSQYSTVGNVFDSMFGYSILKSDGKPLEQQFVKVSKNSDNEFEMYTVNTADGIYAVRLPLIQKEHIVLLDNSTVFGDVIYDVAPGYRQERIRVLGYKTIDWNGSLNIPGFFYDDAKPTQWTPWQDYSVGDIVKYKEFFYTADTKIAGSEVFEENKWIRLANKPNAGLYSNFDYRINQFTDFYDLDSDNFDTEQQRLAQHLIGYQKRQYLENIINDDVSQYKFYQGFIQEKGTRNSLTKLFDALASADKDSLEFFEEWAIKDGQYGASEGFDEVEYKLDESKFRLVPQPILLTDNITGQETDLLYRIPTYQTYLKPKNYDHSPFPEKYVGTGYIKDAGYVNYEDVDFVIGQYSEILQIDIQKVKESDYIWVQNYGYKSWNVLQHINSGYSIEKIEPDNTDIKITINATPTDIKKGDIIGIFDIISTSVTEDSTTVATTTVDPLKGFYKIKDVTLNTITVENSEAVDVIENIEGTLTKFIECRVSNLKDANIFSQNHIQPQENIWIDDNDFANWTVLKNANKFDLLQEVSNNNSGTAINFAKAFAVNDRNTILAVGLPNKDDGQVLIYQRATNSLNYVLNQVIFAPENIADPNQEFGFSIDLSDDGKYLIVGSPSASKVKTKYRGGFEPTADYAQGDIVKKDDQLYEAINPIIGADDNIEFVSFSSVADILFDLNLDEEDSEQIPMLLTGNYPFENVTADHFLVRAPKTQYEGSGEGDEIKLAWNPLTNANQTQLNLVNTLPFGGNVSYLSENYLQSQHTISKKIDAILFVDQSTVIPNIGDTVTTQGAVANVAYTFNVGAQVTIYVNQVNGEFPANNSLFIEGNDFVGEYVLSGPNEQTATSTQLGGYWFVQSSNPYSVTTTTSDVARGLVIYDLIPDSSVTGNYYYNILDFETSTIDSENTDHSYVRVLSFQGSPGPYGTTSPTLSQYWLARAPKAVTDSLTAGDKINFHWNEMKKTVSKMTLVNNVTVVKGEVITQDVTGATATVFQNATNSKEVLLQNITGTFSTVNLLNGSISGRLFTNVFALPVEDTLVQPSDIGLSYTLTNKEQTVFDIWDGYIDYENLFFEAGQPLEPRIGQTLQDMNTGATAEVVFYQRDLNSVRVYVKNVQEGTVDPIKGFVGGGWSRGDDFGNAAEIQMLAFPGGPNPDEYGRVDIYTIDRPIGQVDKVSLGYTPDGIGKLVVFDTGSNISLPTTNEIKDIEYWLYTKTTVLGVPRGANVPAPDNLDYITKYFIPTSTNGYQSNYQNEGMYSIYERLSTGRYEPVNSYIGQISDENTYTGYNVQIRKNNDIYRGYIGQPGPQDSSGISLNDTPGKILFIKKGIENNNTYNWEYARNKKFRGEFSSTTEYFQNDIVYLNDPQGTLYNAITNIQPGEFDATLWDSTDDLIDYVGYIPNNTGLKVINDSSQDSVLDQSEMFDFASSFDVSKNGEVLLAQVKYLTVPNIVAVYRIKDGHYQFSQNIEAETVGSQFGHKVQISDDGKMIAISAPYDDTNFDDQGKVYIYKQKNGVFELVQKLSSPVDLSSQQFGSNIDFDGNNIAITAKNADSFIETTFDNKSTILDQGFTNLKNFTEDTGIVYLYQLINDTFVYGQPLQYNNKYGGVLRFGENIKLQNNHIYVGLPAVQSDDDYIGTLVDFRIAENKNIFEVHRSAKSTVNLEKIKRVILYNTKSKKLLTYLDYIDPIQGKIAGPAEENLRYKLYYDPAYYTNVTDGTSATKSDAFWGNTQVGQLWWDLTNAKFVNPYQDDIFYSVANWNKLADTNSIDIYEWVESNILPAEWDNIADTAEGTPLGISGLSKYGNNAYVQKQVFDSVSQSFSNKYYFWVKNKKIKPNTEFRTLSAEAVAKLISNPADQGYKFVSFVTSNSFTIHNCDSLLEDNDVALSVQYWTIDNQNINIHNQYQIITDGLETSVPNRDIENKWVDSLVGYDMYGREVPDPTLSEKEKYGTLFKPRQSWFVNREEALKQYIERVNRILKTNLIVDNKDISELQRQEIVPDSSLNLYDTTVDTVSDLEFIGVAKAKQAEIQLVIENGTVVDTLILDPGRGYLVAPSFTINGTGTDLELNITINNLGVITNVDITNGGKNFSPNDSITLRKYAVLVNADENIQGRWALYERAGNSWSRIRSQSFNCNNYWDYADWYAPEFSESTKIDNIIDRSYELQTVSDNIGDITKINNVGSGGWLLLRKIDNQENVDYTVNYETIGRQNGTIQFKISIFDTTESLTGFDVTSFDIRFFDSVPTNETRIIINAIKNDLFTEELKVEYNKLFFASLRYVLSEQPFVDWMFKTSFVKAKHNVGNLREDITFNNDNLPSYEEYINEVKPFKTKLREYLSSYERIDNSQSRITDFDLAPTYNASDNAISPIRTQVIDNSIVGLADDLNSYPNKNWSDSVGFVVKEINVAKAGQGYSSAPQIIISGGGGTGAKAVAKLGRGNGVTSIEVINSGSGYISAPTITINGNITEGGTEAKASVVIGQSLPRTIHTLVKFDRTTGNYLITTLGETQTFIGSGSKYIFDLEWPMDLRKSEISVSVDNIVLLNSQYTYENILDNSKGYDRFFGRITLTEPAKNNSSVIVQYKKDINLLQAQDRINLAYNPTTGQFGKDLGQLIEGIDYGGVEVKSFDFGGLTGWDSAPWFTGEYDTYDTTYEDEIITLDGSTNIITLNSALENNVVYNVYKNGIRLDDPDWTDDSTQFTNPNAVMRSIVGNGSQTTINIGELGIPGVADDTFIIRKSTSDGSFLPTNINFDTLITGGTLDYTNATGLASEDINIDGDGFFTPLANGGPEEVMPGQVFDTLDLKVYERPTGGASTITSRNYTGNGIRTVFDIGTGPITKNNLLVKVNSTVKKIDTDYTIDFDNKTVTFTSAPAINSTVSLLSMGYAGENILDIDSFVSDGSTVDFLTNITYSDNVKALVTIEGVEIPHDIVKADNSYLKPGNIIIRFAEAPALDKIVNFGLFIGQTQNYSVVTIDEFESDGSTTSYSLTTTPFSQTPTEWYTLVTINDHVLNAGYNEIFTISSTREYRLKKWQVPLGTLSNKQIKVYINNIERQYIKDWSFSSAGEFDPTIPASQQAGSTITLSRTAGSPGDELRVFILGLDDSTGSGGDYRYGYFDADGDFISTPGVLHIAKNYAVGDIIKVTQFSNHNSQGIDRQSFDVKEKTEILKGTIEGEQVFALDGSTAELELFPLSDRVKYAVFLNDIRIDDINFGTGNTVLNPNAVMKTIEGAGQTVFNLDNNNVSADVGDIIKIKPVEIIYTPTEDTDDYYELRQLRNGIIPLRKSAVDDQYVWVIKNGNLLSPSVDYVLTESKQSIKLVSPLAEDDTVETIHFANKILQQKVGWRQFKDVLNRNHYKRINGTFNYTLAEDLHWWSKSIVLDTTDGLPSPSIDTKTPGVVFIDGERIEYFVKDGKQLKQLRRGTLGTGVKNMYSAGTELYDQNIAESLPYKDEILTTIFTADGTTKTYELDFTPNSINEFEVFVAGRRLRKTALQSYQLDTDLRTTYAATGEQISQDSPEGDITLPAEFSIDNGNELTLTDFPAENQKVIVIRKQGKLWSPAGTALVDSDTDVAKFVRAAQPDLPG